MKAFLMHEATDVDLMRALPDNEEDLLADLELAAVLEVMAGGDHFIEEVAKRALLLPLVDPPAIIYRQQVLSDCLENPSATRSLYDLAVETVAAERHIWGIHSSRPDSVLHRSTRAMEIFAEALRRLRRLGDEQGSAFRSPGFMRFFEMLAKELDDDYLDTLTSQLKELRFKAGTLVSVGLGPGNTGVDYVLRIPQQTGWAARLTPFRRSSFSFEVASRDEAGKQALNDLRGRGINLVADALARSVDQVRGFFNLLAAELAFYVGCLNLHDRLSASGCGTSLPQPEPPAPPSLSVAGLYDVALALRLGEEVVGNDLRADGKRLVMITGVNSGGKSTFLRALGQAQLMAQSGMFVGAEEMRFASCSAVFSHFRREEDATMHHGKLDEELARMRSIAEAIEPSSLLLCNESFSSTNEQEGSEIARQVVRAMVEAGVKVAIVTHLYDLSSSLYEMQRSDAVFLRAERLEETGRPFVLREGAPLPTSFGEGLFAKIFGERSAD